MFNDVEPWLLVWRTPLVFLMITWYKAGLGHIVVALRMDSLRAPGSVSFYVNAAYRMDQ